MNLKKRLPADCKLLTHLMTWFQPGSTHNSNAWPFGQYDSADPAVIARQIDLMQNLGIDVAMVDWYGAQNTHGDAAVKELLRQAEQVNFKIGICIDKGAISATAPTQDFTNELNYVMLAYATSSAFFRDFIMEFGCGKKGVTSWPTSIPILHDDPTYGNFYSWVGLPDGASTAALSYRNSKCQMGSIVFDFDDAAPSNPANSVWGGTVRLMTRYKAGFNWQQSFNYIPATMKYVQIVTWNDYEEGTAVEYLADNFS